MASAQPSTSSSVPEGSQCNVLKETTRIISRVMQKCEAEVKDNTIPIHNPMKRAMGYTGLHKSTLKMLEEHKSNINSKNLKNLDRGIVHKELLTFYLQDHKLPTTKQLFNALEGKIPIHIDIKLFRKLLIKMGYMWKNIKYTLFVIERPRVTFERYNYLKSLQHYRETNIPIYYIDENILEPAKNSSCTFKSLAENIHFIPSKHASEIRFVTYALSNNGVHFTKILSSFGEEEFENWVEEYLTKLPVQSVIVLPNMKHNNCELESLPTINSVKIEMMDWLEYHNVPCNINMSKNDLYTLIESHTDLRKIYKIDNILKLHGHIILRIPDSINQITLCPLVRQLIASNFKGVNLNDGPPFLEKLILSIRAHTLAAYDDIVVAQEKELLLNDNNVDLVMDSLVARMANQICSSEDEDSDLPTFSDSD